MQIPANNFAVLSPIRRTKILRQRSASSLPFPLNAACISSRTGLVLSPKRTNDGTGCFQGGMSLLALEA